MDVRPYLFRDVPSKQALSPKEWLKLLNYRFDNEEYRFHDVLFNPTITLEALFWLLENTIEEDHDDIYKAIFKQEGVKAILKKANLDFVNLGGEQVWDKERSRTIKKKIVNMIKNQELGTG